MPIVAALENELISCVVCTAVAGVVTVLRLYIRRGRYWWDDALALFAILFQVLMLASTVLHVQEPATLTVQDRIAGYYLLPTTFYCVIWSSRLSILFSVLRLDPYEVRRRRLLLVAILFAVFFVVLMAQIFWICETHPGWKSALNPQCPLGEQAAVSQLVTDIIADSLLLAAPLKLLQGLEDKGLRRRLIVIFSTCIATTIASLAHAVLIIQGSGAKVLIAAFVEQAVSIIVADIPVVVTAGMRTVASSSQQTSSVPSPSFMKFATYPSKHQKTTFGGATTQSNTQTQSMPLGRIRGGETTAISGFDPATTLDLDLESHSKSPRASSSEGRGDSHSPYLEYPKATLAL